MPSRYSSLTAVIPFVNASPEHPAPDVLTDEFATKLPFFAPLWRYFAIVE